MNVILQFNYACVTIMFVGNKVLLIIAIKFDVIKNLLQYTLFTQN